MAAPRGDNAIVAPAPVVVVEISSPHIQGSDTGVKLADYVSIDAIAHDLIVRPMKRQVIHHRRIPSGTDTTILSDGEIVLGAPGVTASIERFYAVD